jgi:hypothetical protein
MSRPSEKFGTHSITLFTVHDLLKMLFERQIHLLEKQPLEPAQGSRNVSGNYNLFQYPGTGLSGTTEQQKKPGSYPGFRVINPD